MEKINYSLILEDTVYTLEQLNALPLTGRPQVALAGRSNVGKSSLINALAGRKQLAKVSSTPGKTASINYYRVEPGNFYLVDLPGYGYAQRSKTEREKWGQLISAYLQNSKDLRCLAVLLDSRLNPQQIDLDLIAYARSLDLPLLPVLTKADKCNQKERSAQVKLWKTRLAGVTPVLTSASGQASTRIGIDALWQSITAAVSDFIVEQEAGAASPEFE